MAAQLNTRRLTMIAAACTFAACSEDPAALFDPAANVLDARYAMQSLGGAALPLTIPDTAAPPAFRIITGDTLFFYPDGYFERRLFIIEVYPASGGIGFDSTSGTFFRSGAYEVLGQDVIVWQQYPGPVAVPDTLEHGGQGILEVTDRGFQKLARYQVVP